MRQSQLIDARKSASLQVLAGRWRWNIRKLSAGVARQLTEPVKTARKVAKVTAIA
jgi:hypothetical protein